jgi:hypothetical protein
VSRVAAALVVTLALTGEAAAQLPSCHDRRSSGPDFAMAGGKLRACYAGGRAACFVLDLRTTGPAWTGVVPPRASPAEPPPPIVPDLTIGTTAKVCAVDGTDCHTFVTPHAPVSKFFGPQVYADPNRSVFAVTLDDKVWLYEAAGTLRATIKTWAHPGNVVWSVEQAVVSGDRVYVMMRSGIDAEVRAFSVRDGSASSDVGAVEPVDPIDLGGGQVAFAMRRGGAVDVYDRAAKRVRSVPVFADHKAPVTVFARTGDGKAIVIARWESTAIAAVDTTTWTVSTILPPPICP